jgi:N-acetylmuramoyl-L-alanine amidase
MMAYDVALDIGHGSDTWERGGGKGVKKNGVVYEEHTANSDVAQRVLKILEAHGLKVWLPQKPMSKEVPLAKRTNEANRLGVKLYWSIHFNAGSPSASGVCAFYWYTAKEAKKLAEQYTKEARAMGFKIFGTGAIASVPKTWTDFHVCRETKMTAILTENGFMTNSDDFEGIFGKNKEQYRQRIAELNAKTILSFFGKKYEPSKTKVKEPVKTTQPKEAKKTIYRVIVNGVQVGAYTEENNTLSQVEKALKQGKASIKVEKV